MFQLPTLCSHRMETPPFLSSFIGGVEIHSLPPRVDMKRGKKF